MLCASLFKWAFLYVYSFFYCSLLIYSIIRYSLIFSSIFFIHSRWLFRSASWYYIFDEVVGFTVDVYYYGLSKWKYVLFSDLHSYLRNFKLIYFDWLIDHYIQPFRNFSVHFRNSHTFQELFVHSRNYWSGLKILEAFEKFLHFTMATYEFLVISEKGAS